MHNSIPHQPPLRGSWCAAAALREPDVEPDGPVLLPFPQAGLADRLFARETLLPPGVRRPPAVVAEPYSLQWFLDIERQRHGRRGRWLPRLLEFNKHAGETLLGLGRGLGTDWVQYARHGATVVVAMPAADELALARRNFELRGLGGRFLRAGPATLPLDSASIDVVCAAEPLADIGDPRPIVEEIYRVLKPGGKVLALVPARYDVRYWSRLVRPWRFWTDGEPTGARGGDLRRLFGRFVEHRVHKRHLRRAEVPHLWRWLPLPVVERLMGHFLILKAFKPLSAAIALQAAA